MNYQKESHSTPYPVTSTGAPIREPTFNKVPVDANMPTNDGGAGFNYGAGKKMGFTEEMSYGTMNDLYDAGKKVSERYSQFLDMEFISFTA